MATLEDITAALGRAFSVRHIGEQSLKIDFKGEGFVFIKGATVTNEDAPADCTLTLSKHDFERIMSGDLDAREAMANGRLSVLGDVGVASKMQHIIASAWA